MAYGSRHVGMSRCASFVYRTWVLLVEVPRCVFVYQHASHGCLTERLRDTVSNVLLMEKGR